MLLADLAQNHVELFCRCRRGDDSTQPHSASSPRLPRVSVSPVRSAHIPDHIEQVLIRRHGLGDRHCARLRAVFRDPFMPGDSTQAGQCRQFTSNRSVSEQSGWVRARTLGRRTAPRRPSNTDPFRAIEFRGAIRPRWLRSRAAWQPKTSGIRARRPWVYPQRAPAWSATAPIDLGGRWRRADGRSRASRHERLGNRVGPALGSASATALCCLASAAWACPEWRLPNVRLAQTMGFNLGFLKIGRRNRHVCCPGGLIRTAAPA